MQLVFVEVLAQCNPDGSVLPLRMNYDGFPFSVEVRGVAPAMIPLTGGTGLCFNVLFKGHRRKLYMDLSKGKVQWILEKLEGPEKKARHCCVDLL